VVAVDEQRKVIEVRPSPGGRVPSFSGERGDVHDKIRQEMRVVYMANAMPAYLDATARDLLLEARKSFSEYGLDARSVVPAGAETIVFTWMGDRVNDTLAVWFRYHGHIAANEGACVRVFAGEPDTMEALRRMASEPIPDPIALAARVQNKQAEKYDWLLGEALLNAEYASRKLDVNETRKLVERLLGDGAGRDIPMMATNGEIVVDWKRGFE
jgi:ATP-dependent Lhr-like helicase